MTYYLFINFIDKGDSGDGLFSIPWESGIKKLGPYRLRIPPPSVDCYENTINFNLIKWFAVSGANVGGYNIYRADNSAGPFTLIAANVQGTSYEDTNIVLIKSYYYFIRTIDTDPNTTPDYRESVDYIVIGVDPYIDLTKPQPDEPSQKFITRENPVLNFGTEVDKVTIRTPSGVPVWSFERTDPTELIIWKSTDESGIAVESGVYVYQYEVERRKKYGTVVVIK